MKRLFLLVLLSITFTSQAKGVDLSFLVPKSTLYSFSDDIVIKIDNDVRLTANVFIPTAKSAQQQFPAVIFVNSWALEEHEYLKQAIALAKKGYVVLSYTTRGFGQSSGVINTAGPKDIADFTQVLDYLESNFPVNDKIASAGISYGAGISLLGAAQDSRIKAVIAMSGWAELERALYANNSPRKLWASVLVISGKLLGRIDPVVEKNWNIVNRQEIASLPIVRKWIKPRSPLYVFDKLNQNGTAIFLSKNWGDNMFQPNPSIELFDKLTTPKYLMLQSGTHAATELAPSLDQDYIWSRAYEWLGHHLKGENNYMALGKNVELKPKLGKDYEQYRAFPPKKTIERTYHLYPRVSVSTFSPTGKLKNHNNVTQQKSNVINSGSDTILSTGIFGLAPVAESFLIPTMTPVPLSLRKFSVYYETPPLENRLSIRGVPNLKLNVASSSDTAQIVAYLYDMDAIGASKLITHGVITLPRIQSNQRYDIDFDLVATAYDVPAGHRVVLAIDTKDPLYSHPTSEAFDLRIHFGRDMTNSLRFPVTEAANK